MARPSIERLFPLCHELMSLVHGCDAGDCTSRVVQDLIRDMGRNAEPSHARHRRPTQVMKSPAGDTGLLVELRLRMDEVTKWPVGGGEHESSRSRPCLDRPDCGSRQMHNVWLTVLRSAAGDCP